MCSFLYFVFTFSIVFEILDLRHLAFWILGVNVFHEYIVVQYINIEPKIDSLAEVSYCFKIFLQIKQL
jgi:hypothetical protein